MSKQTHVVASRRQKKLKPHWWSKAFVIIFCILLVVGVLLALFLFTPLYNVVVDGYGMTIWSLGPTAPKVAQQIASGFNMQYPFCLIGSTSTSELWSSFFFLYMYYLMCLACLFVISLPLFAIGRVRLKKKSGKPRRYAIAVVLLLIVLFFSFCLLAMPWSKEYDALGFIRKLFVPIQEALFNSGKPLEIIGSYHPYLGAVVFTTVAVFILSIILEIFVLPGGNNAHAKAKKVPYYVREQSDIAEEEETILPPSAETPVTERPVMQATATTAPAAAQITTPVFISQPTEYKPAVAPAPAPAADSKPTPTPAPAAKPQETVPELEVKPTATEVAILNSLEPLALNPVNSLPGYYKTEADSILNALEPKSLSSVDYIPDETDLTDKIATILNSLDNKQKEVDTLPGINETGETPWAQTATTEELKDVTTEAQPEAISEPVIEELTHAEIQNEAQAETNEEATTYTPKETDATVIAVNQLEEEDKEYNTINQEEAEDAISAESRYDSRVVTTENTHEEVRTSAETRTVVVEKVVAPAPVAEPVVEETAPAPAQEAPIEETPAEEDLARKRITPVAPMARQEEVVQEEAEKQLSAVTGPLHAIREGARKDIKPVEARKVKFDLQQYRIKTYEGDLSAEEAFTKGVTKVQPVVNPVFVNQTQGGDYLQRKHDEDVRKAGYTNVTTAKIVKPIRPISSGNKPMKKATSIRELARQKKENTTSSDTTTTEEPKTE